MTFKPKINPDSVIMDPMRYKLAGMVNGIEEMKQSKAKDDNSTGDIGEPPVDITDEEDAKSRSKSRSHSRNLSDLAKTTGKSLLEKYKT